LWQKRRRTLLLNPLCSIALRRTTTITKEGPCSRRIEEDHPSQLPTMMKKEEGGGLIYL
jgi:hypothetical protein